MPRVIKFCHSVDVKKQIINLFSHHLAVVLGTFRMDHVVFGDFAPKLHQFVGYFLVMNRVHILLEDGFG